MRLLMIDPHVGGGHHTSYVEAVGEEALRRGWHVVAAFAEGQGAHPAFRRIADLVARFRKVLVVPRAQSGGNIPGVNYVASQLRRLAFLKRAVAEAAVSGPFDAAFVVDCDSWYPAASMVGGPTEGIPLTTIAFRVRFHHSRVGINTRMNRVVAQVQEFLFRRFVAANLGRVMVTDDDRLTRYLSSQGASIAGKVLFVPELAELPPLPPARSAREELGIALESSVVLSLGGQTARKGLAHLIDAANRCPERVALLIAGSQDASARAILSSLPARRLKEEQRLYVIPHFLETDEMARCFAASTVAWLGYRDHFGPSAFLWQSVAASLPVVACAQGLIGHWVDRENLGITADTADPEEAARALVQAAGMAPQGSCARAAWSTKARDHSPRAFGTAVCDAVVEPLRRGGGATEDVPVCTDEPS